MRNGNEGTEGGGVDPTRTFDLSGRTVAILATDGFEQSELVEPLRALREAGATAHVVSLPESRETIRGWAEGDWGDRVPVDRTLDEATADEYDGLVLPGGVMNPDRLRLEPKAVDFVRAFFRQHKPVAAICHGPWMLVEADAVRDRKLTSWPSIRKDLENAGARWLDAEVVVDEGLVTSRKPDDLPAFNRKLLEEVHEGAHAAQTL